MSNLFEKLIRPVLFRLDAERAHEIALTVLRSGVIKMPAMRADESERIARTFGPIRRFGLDFRNPLGIAAGFDKNGLVVNQLASLGFGFVEVGTVTYEPQPGNPRPRLFRLPENNALINRLGFNNDGARVVAERLARLDRRCVVGVNIGRNKDVSNENAVENYLATFELIHPVADYIVVNVSSPNTPELRDLQSAERLESLMGALQARNEALGRKPLLVKIAPDLTENDLRSIVDECLRLKIDGIVATNTTVSRVGLQTTDAGRFGPGGLSGRPLSARSNDLIAAIYRQSNGNLPIIGAGGVFTAEDAFEKIAAGASLIQAYTGFVYSGPSFARRTVRGLAEILKRRGFRSLDESVGSGLYRP